MTVYRLEREQFIARPRERVFAFFADASNLETITPPWLKFRIATPGPVEMKRGARIEYQIRWHFLRLTWLTEIAEWDPPHSFVDVQLEGPYKLWRHHHVFAPENGGTRLFDHVCYRLPLGPLGAAAHRLKVRRDLEAIFDYRERRISEFFEKEASATA